MPGTGHEIREQGVGSRLRRAIPEILRRWEGEVRHQVEAAQGKPALLLIDHVPLLLEEIADALESPAAGWRAPVAHAEQRAAAGDYSLEQVLREYHLLRGVVLEVLHAEGHIAWPELRALIELLDNGVEESAHHFVELQQQELASLLADREAAIGAREHLTRVVTHELRNPLQTIAIAGEVLAHPDLAADRRDEQAKAIRRGVRRMERLLDDLSEAARLERGALRLEKHPVSPRTLAREALRDVEEKAAETGVELKRSVASDLPLVLADRDRIVQVLANLLDNAVKFTPQGGRVQVTAEPHGEAAVRFAVADTGPGIPEGDVPHLFEPYWQGKPGVEGGSGLGLSIVRGIVRAHGGEVWPETSEAGTTMFFTLPRA